VCVYVYTYEETEFFVFSKLLYTVSLDDEKIFIEVDRQIDDGDSRLLKKIIKVRERVCV